MLGPVSATEPGADPAIEARCIIEFDYDGHHRRVQPATVGTHVTTGNPILRGYQVAGTGKSREVPFWDLYLLEKMVNLKTTEDTFDEDPPGYKPGDTHIDVETEL
jgi:hypothetical protein